MVKFLVISLTIFFSKVILAGTTNREFSVGKVSGVAKFTVNCYPSNIKQAKKFLWNFGDGENLVTTNSNITHIYQKAGTFTASLKYQVNASDKNPNYKEAGSVQIVVTKSNISPIAI
jgi:hypothetical protein